MKSIQDIRKAIDDKLDFFQAKAEAAQVQMALGNMELQQRLGDKFDSMRDAATDLHRELLDLASSDGEIGQKVQQAVDQMQVRLALGEMDSKDALQAVKADIEQRINQFDAAIDACAAADDETATQLRETLDKYIRQAAAVKAEVEARLDAID